MAKQKSCTAIQILRKTLPEATFHKKTASGVTMMNRIGEAQFL
jgi:hypothetical protein